MQNIKNNKLYIHTLQLIYFYFKQKKQLYYKPKKKANQCLLYKKKQLIYMKAHTFFFLKQTIVFNINKKHRSLIYIVYCFTIEYYNIYIYILASKKKKKSVFTNPENQTSFYTNPEYHYIYIHRNLTYIYKASGPPKKFLCIYYFTITNYFIYN